MALDEGVWSFFQKHLGYNDEEMKRFRENPRNEEILSTAPELMNKTIVSTRWETSSISMGQATLSPNSTQRESAYTR
jgi:hypothetical protein